MMWPLARRAAGPVIALLRHAIAKHGFRVQVATLE